MTNFRLRLYDCGLHIGVAGHAPAKENSPGHRSMLAGAIGTENGVREPYGARTRERSKRSADWVAYRLGPAASDTAAPPKANPARVRPGQDDPPRSTGVDYFQPGRPDMSLVVVRSRQLGRFCAFLPQCRKSDGTTLPFQGL